jgi:hypothetical protein
MSQDAGMRRATAGRPAVVVVLLSVVLATAVAALAGPLASPPARTATPAPPAARDVLAGLPLAFEPGPDSGFVARGPGYSVTLDQAGAAVRLDRPSPADLALRPVGGSAAALVGGDLLPGTASHLVGDDPASWRTGLPTYGTVAMRGVWPGVDVVWHGNARRLEHDVVVAPGADPAVAVFDVPGARRLTIDGRGDLVVDLGPGAPPARLDRPVVYQDGGGTRRRVDGELVLRGPNQVGFRVGAYDTGRPLVIDPTLVSSTYLGGAGTDTAYGVAVDRAGNTYVTGSTDSADFPTARPLQGAISQEPGTPAGSAKPDVFVAKLNPAGDALVWSTYLGGRGRDTGYGVAVGADGAVYVAGVTESADFPRNKAVKDTYGGGPSDAFVTKLNASGTGLEWSTFLGGKDTDGARGIAVDGSGNAYVTGATSSTDFPSVSPLQGAAPRADDVDAFVAKLAADGSALAFSTRLGGANDDHGLAVAVDGTGSAYITGDTRSPGFPTVRPFQASSGASANGVAGSFTDAFVSKLNPSGSALAYSTFLGGSDSDQGTGIAVDSSGAAYVVGNTNSPNFPTANALQPRKAEGDTDAFVSKLDPQGGTLVYSTYVGGTGADGATAVALDPSGSAFVAGTTGSSNLPTVKPVQPVKGGGFADGFVMKLTPAGTGSQFTTYLGGHDEDQVSGIAVDGTGVSHVVGMTGSADFPTARPVQAARSAPGTGPDAFVVSVSPAEGAAVTTPGAAPAATPARASKHDRQVKVLTLLTVGLFLVALLQTLYLRRRPRPAPATEPAATPAPWPAEAAGGGGVTVLDDDPDRTQPVPVPRKASGARKGPASGPRKAPATRRRPAAPPPGGHRPEPAIADLLDEQPWAPGQATVGPGDTAWDEAAFDGDPSAPAPDPAGAPAAEAAAGALAGAGGDGPAAPLTPPEAAPDPSGGETADAPAIPPVPAEELSFWDLFPEDLPPPSRPGTGFPADDLLADGVPGPDAPRPAPRPDIGELVMTELLGTEQTAGKRPDPRRGPTAGPGSPPQSEIVIGELLEGPPSRRSDERRPPPPPVPGDNDFLLSDLLDDDVDGPADHEDAAGDDDGTGDGDDGPGMAGRSTEERARPRKRSRRSGRRRRPS